MALTKTQLMQSIATAKFDCKIMARIDGIIYVEGCVGGQHVAETFITERGAARGVIALRARHIAHAVKMPAPLTLGMAEQDPDNDALYMAMFAKALQ